MAVSPESLAWEQGAAQVQGAEADGEARGQNLLVQPAASARGQCTPRPGSRCGAPRGSVPVCAASEWTEEVRKLSFRRSCLRMHIQSEEAEPGKESLSMDDASEEVAEKP